MSKQQQQQPGSRMRVRMFDSTAPSNKAWGSTPVSRRVRGIPQQPHAITSSSRRFNNDTSRRGRPQQQRQQQQLTQEQQRVVVAMMMPGHGDESPPARLHKVLVGAAAAGAFDVRTQQGSSCGVYKPGVAASMARVVVGGDSMQRKH